MRIPSTGAACSRSRAAPFDWSRHRPDRRSARPTRHRGAAVPHRRPELGRAPVPVPGDAAAKAPAHLPATGAAAGAWSSFAQRSRPSLRAERQLLGRKPDRAQAPDPDLADLERGELQVLRRQAEPGRIRQAREALLHGDQSGRPGGQVVLGGMFARPKGCQRERQTEERVYCRLDFLEQMYEKTPGIKTKFQGVALHPYTDNYQELTAEIEEFREVLSANDDAAKGLWITELGWSSQPPAPATNIFAKGLSRPGEPAERRLHPARAPSRRNGSCSGSTGSRSTTRRAPATSATAPASSPRASCRRSPGSPT